MVDQQSAPGPSQDGAPASAAEVRARFADELRRLRLNAGNPSFRAMASHAHSVSHTTLHEAVTGRRLPTWPTTCAFVEACGGDAAEWRARWQAAATASEPGKGPETELRRSADTGPTPIVGEDAKPGASGRAGCLLAAVATGCAITGAGATLYAVQHAHGGRPAARPSRATVSTTALSPLHPGDRSVFLSDITVPDGTRVKTGEHFEKVWEIGNVGSVTWHGRFLERGEDKPGQAGCETPSRVPIADTAPGQRVRISVPVKAPASPGTCWIWWKMVDAEDRLLLPGARPVFFSVTVVR